MNGKSIGAGSLLVRVSRAKTAAMLAALAVALLLALASFAVPVPAYADEGDNGTIENSTLESYEKYPPVAYKTGVYGVYIADCYSPSDEVSEYWYNESSNARYAPSNVAVSSSNSSVLAISREDGDDASIDITVKAAGTAILTVSYKYIGIYSTYQASRSFSVTVAASTNPVAEITLGSSTVVLPFVDCPVCNALSASGPKQHYEEQELSYSVAAANGTVPTQFFVTALSEIGASGNCIIDAVDYYDNGSMLVSPNNQDSLEAKNYALTIHAYDCSDGDEVTAACTVTAENVGIPKIAANSSFTMQMGDTCNAFTCYNFDGTPFYLDADNDEAAQLVLNNHDYDALQLLISSVTSSDSDVVAVESEQVNVGDDVYATVYSLAPKAAGTATVTLTDVYGNKYAADVTVEGTTTGVASFALSQDSVTYSVLENCPVDGCGETHFCEYPAYIACNVVLGESLAGGLPGCQVEASTGDSSVVAASIYGPFGADDKWEWNLQLIPMGAGSTTVTVTCTDGDKIFKQDVAVAITATSEVPKFVAASGFDLSVGEEKPFQVDIRTDVTSFGALLTGNDAADAIWFAHDNDEIIEQATIANASVASVGDFALKAVAAGMTTLDVTDYAGNVYSVPVTVTAAVETQAMYRLYNPNSGEHFYTASAEEKTNLVNAGWNYEGIGWTAPKSSNTPVYRMYNPNPSPKTGSGEHHYTTSSTERDSLIAAGWKYEGIGWYSDDAETTPLYRLYNPNEYNNNHHYTTSTGERDNLLSLGWRDEGIAWYGVDQ